MSDPAQNEAGAKAALRAKVAEIAERLGARGRSLADDESLLQTGAIDSAGMMELILWIEMEFDREIDLDALDLENFGSIDAMARFLAESDAAPAAAPLDA